MTGTLQSLIALLICLAAFAVTLAAVLTGWKFQDRQPLSRWGIAVALGPAVVFLALFISLGFHMHRHFDGNWPNTIEDLGFSEALKLHVDIAVGYFATLVGATIFVWPLLLLVSVFVAPLRRLLFYLGLYGIGFFLVLGAIFAAPGGFRNWWLD